MHLNSELLYREYVPELISKHQNPNILEIGPAGYPSIFRKIVESNQQVSWKTLDFQDSQYIQNANSKLDFAITDPYAFPIEDNSFDFVLSGQVIEHVPAIWKWIKEIKRILKPDGISIIISPISWGYHEAPLDCWRIYPDGLKALHEEAGLEVVTCTYKSLEIQKLKDDYGITDYYFGDSYAYIMSDRHLKQIGRFNSIVGKIPKLKNFKYKVPVSLDAITIARK